MSAIAITIVRASLFILEFNFIFSAIPQYEKCQLTDTQCLTRSSQKTLAPFVAGVPELGTQVLDTLLIPSIKFELSGLKLSMKDAELKGLKKSVIHKVSFNTKKKQMELNFHVEDFVLKGQYLASGRLLILPISGDGIMTIKMKHMTIHVIYPYEIIKNKIGKDVINLKSYKFNFEFKDNMNFQLTNLFNGNKQLSDIMHTFMNQNWKPVSDEFGRPMIDSYMVIIFKNMKQFLNQQALEDITLK